MKSADERGRINSHDFVNMFLEMATRPEINFLLIRFANKDYFTAEDFRQFLECEQGVSTPFPRHHSPLFPLAIVLNLIGFHLI